MSEAEIVELARSTPREKLAVFLGVLETARMTARERLLQAPAPEEESKLLNIQEAATILGCSVHWLRRHELPCTRRVGRRVLYHSGELQKFIRSKR
jgi:helix-turn-helix protein